MGVVAGRGQSVGRERCRNSTAKSLNRFPVTEVKFTRRLKLFIKSFDLIDYVEQEDDDEQDDYYGGSEDFVDDCLQQSLDADPEWFVCFMFIHLGRVNISVHVIFTCVCTVSVFVKIYSSIHPTGIHTSASNTRSCGVYCMTK